jgi:hypothetical protein
MPQLAIHEERARRLLSDTRAIWESADREGRRAILFGLFQKLYITDRAITTAVAHQDVYGVLMATAAVL